MHLSTDVAPYVSRSVLVRITGSESVMTRALVQFSVPYSWPVDLLVYTDFSMDANFYLYGRFIKDEFTPRDLWIVASIIGKPYPAYRAVHKHVGQSHELAAVL